MRRIIPTFSSVKGEGMARSISIVQSLHKVRDHDQLSFILFDFSSIMSSPFDRIKCFTIDGNKVKRSFVLRPTELTAKKLTHLSLISNPSLYNPQTGEQYFPDDEGKFNFDYDTKIEYEVRLGNSSFSFLLPQSSSPISC